MKFSRREFLWLSGLSLSSSFLLQNKQVAQAKNIVLNAAGATFPVILYQRWFVEYRRKNWEVTINYQPIGSAAGIQQMIAETVDFAGSDIAMTDAEIAQVSRGIVMLPMTAGSVAVVYNLPKIGSGLKLSREVLSEIFLGKIDRWNDQKIANLNPGILLPDLPIIVVHRSDGSGTTAVFTKHLSSISNEWERRVGSGLNVAWPIGFGIKSNSGVSAQIQQAEGTIGYVEYSFAKQLKLSTAALENKAGKYIQPNLETTSNALASVELPENLRGFVSDPDGFHSYPIVTYSWLLAYKRYDDAQKANAIKNMIRWALNEGQRLSKDLGFVPLSSDVVRRVAAASREISF